MMRSARKSFFAVAGCAALLAGVAAGCGGSDNGGGGGSAGSGGGGSAGSGGGGDGGGGGDMTGPGGPVGESYACPTDKPQKQYGWLPGAKNVLDSDETWTPDNVYLIYGPLDVPTTLTIMAGTVVCFDSGPPGADENPEGPPGSIRFRDQGAFKILGTASQHVVFAPHSDGHGLYWGAISIGPMVKTDISTMQYLDVYNAGISSNGPALATFNSTFDAPTQPPLDMQNVVFRSVQRNGLTNYTQGFTAASKVTVQSYAPDSIDGSKGADYLLDYPILRMNPIAAKTLTATNFTFGPNVPKSVQYVQLDHPEGALLSANPITLHKLAAGLAWRNIANMKLLNTMTLDPGVVFQVNRNGGIEVGGHADGSGNIVAVGTAQDPIVFTSDAPSQSLTPAAAGDWGSLVFEGGNFDASVSKFDYVTFEYGGGVGVDQAQNCSDGVNTVYAPILFTLPSDGQSYAGPAITHSTFAHSAGQAIRSTCSTNYCLTTDYTTTAAGNTFSDVKVAPVEYWSGNETSTCM